VLKGSAGLGRSFSVRVPSTWGSFAEPTGGFAIEWRAFRVGLVALPDNEALYKEMERLGIE
jgi:hypothetical protein